MRGRKGGDRVLNKTPHWVIEGLAQMEVTEPMPTPDILLELDHYRAGLTNPSRNRHATHRYYDHSPQFIVFVLKRLGWRNTTQGTGKAAMWVKG
jgi:hypothetical protein